MTIQRYIPRFEPPPNESTDGSVQAKFYTEEGVVHLFTYPGSDQHCAFTTLEMWIHPHIYHARLDRHYHHRWHGRIARQFAWECGKASEAA